jgi:ferric-dicitrate binding protein FerR (iron transport regulator)
MTPLPPERRFDELFVRYWDDRLTDAELAELSSLLTADPLARDWFRLNSLHAVAAADLRSAVPTASPPSSHRAWSRRRVIQFLGGGLAATVTAGWFGRRFFADPAVRPVLLTAARGGVTVTTADGRPLPPSGPLPPDATVTTHDANSSAVLVYPNGSDVLLAGESSVSLPPTGLPLKLTRGSAIAEVVPAKIGERPFAVLTAEALVSAVGNAFVTLTHVGQATEVGVHTGQVAVTAPSGEPIGSVRDGEMFTVRADGHRSKQPLPGPADTYVLDPAQPLPDGWFVGNRDARQNPPVIQPELWYDPYHKAEMFQIRSHHRWARGLFQLHADSEVCVRYRVHTSGRGQVSLVSRTASVKDTATGVLEWNGWYEAGGDDGWRSLKVRAGDMLDNKEAPKFGPPWVTFLMIFNTYGTDLGLEVANFRVSRPGGRCEG